MRSLRATVWLLLLALAGSLPAAAQLSDWRDEWPSTDFSRRSVEFAEIVSVLRRDNIPSIDRPEFAHAAADALPGNEPVISFVLGGDARAYPLRFLMWHEIVNDVVGDTPVAVTYCPLCNSAVVFDRRLGGRTLDFGTTGKLRASDLVMYDRQTMSWWQQFVGEGIVGEMTGQRLATRPSRIESYARFRERHPRGRVLVPNEPGMRDYGVNPYVGYDGRSTPYMHFFASTLPTDIAPMAHVVAVGEVAWPLDLLRERREILAEDLRLRWEPGAASALDQGVIDRGRDLGNVTVERRVDGVWQDEVYDLTFAFAFRAFRPQGELRRN